VPKASIVSRFSPVLIADQQLHALAARCVKRQRQQRMIHRPSVLRAATIFGNLNFTIKSSMNCF
jgi:hypothetical protein